MRIASIMQALRRVGRATWRCAVAGLSVAAVSATASADSYRIGLSMHFMRDDYSVRLVETMRDVVSGHPGASIIVTDANATPHKQITDLENLIVQDVDAIIVVPIDEKAVLPAIRRSNAASIPVIAITRIPGAEVITTIAANGDYANGKASGEQLVAAMGGAGKVATIGIPYSLWRIDERERGFRDAIAGTDIEIVVQQSGLDQARVQDTVGGILLAHPDIGGIWCTFSNQLVGAADALRAANRKDIALTGIDADRAIIERIRSGWISGAAAQFPEQQGRLAARAALTYLQGETVETDYEVPVGLVTPDNVDSMSTKIWGE